MSLIVPSVIFNTPRQHGTGIENKKSDAESTGKSFKEFLPQQNLSALGTTNTTLNSIIPTQTAVKVVMTKTAIKLYDHTQNILNETHPKNILNLLA